MQRKAGVLMAISSLPTPYGIGDFGPRAYQFVDELAQNHVKIWQILPFNRLGFGNSPYQPHSSIAGDEIFISPDLLLKEKLLTAEDIHPFNDPSGSVEYDRTRQHKNQMLIKAFERFQQSKELQTTFKNFELENPWLESYAVFMTFKKINDMRLWLEWPEEHKSWIHDKKFDLSSYKNDILYQKFLQFIFFKQWHNLKSYANTKGLQIMGDIPFYVGIDSIDVWENQESFLLNPDGSPSFIAGVPPDYFSTTGQRWGNPIYDWNKMQANHYQFWVERLSANMKAFDIIRIDHFRAFDTYWKIPASCETAIDGEWIEGPSYYFFKSIYEQLPTLNIVAEDLGEMRPEVYYLRDYFNLTGMKIIQFTFDPQENNNNFNDRENMMIYTGTHDNQTIRGWYESQPKDVQIATENYLNEQGIHGEMQEKWLRFALSSIAKWAIIPTQDILGLDDHARMNEPGTIGSPNWQWQMQDQEQWSKAIQSLGDLIGEYHRD
ncbi:4-alpha-glucanotransferase [Entomospira entomophila]|uniref:4-alpha-glucanotransferase n=1 Tax=Entomospira entomophila TaxID=2719988 RepID=A0A968GB43_9SPIO|nr:4-alpha-glucanotransferase [Entomospira entomophilus]NIZ40388.1 4-alpha-glucanotransferase [Entomospira entomophilus]WDI35947.1 4-alpha-glucanotransferase [Entomospira entomophilus]